MTRLLLFPLMFLAGCATSPYKVDYFVSPPGASLFYENDNGKFPFRRFDSLAGEAREYYGSKNPEQHTDKQGCYMISKITAYWISGASVSVRPRLCNGPGDYSFTLLRPAGPGREQDVEHGIQLVQQAQAQAAAEKAQKQATKQAKRAQRDAEEAALLKAIFTKPQRTTTDCTSRVSGNRVYTNCN